MKVNKQRLKINDLENLKKNYTIAIKSLKKSAKPIASRRLIETQWYLVESRNRLTQM